MGKDIGQWKEVAIASSGTTSAEVDLGSDFRDVQVINPAIDSSTIAVQMAMVTAGTFVATYTFDADATGDYANATSARTAAGMSVFRDICARYIKIVVASQTGGARTFYVRGIGLI